MAQEDEPTPPIDPLDLLDRSVQLFALVDESVEFGSYAEIQNTAAIAAALFYVAAKSIIVHDASACGNPTENINRIEQLITTNVSPEQDVEPPVEGLSDNLNYALRLAVGSLSPASQRYLVEFAELQNVVGKLLNENPDH